MFNEEKNQIFKFVFEYFPEFKNVLVNKFGKDSIDSINNDIDIIDLICPTSESPKENKELLRDLAAFGDEIYKISKAEEQLLSVKNDFVKFSYRMKIKYSELSRNINN